LLALRLILQQHGSGDIKILFVVLNGEAQTLFPFGNSGCRALVDSLAGVWAGGVLAGVN